MLKTSCEECPGRLIGSQRVTKVEGPNSETKYVTVTWMILQHCEKCGETYWSPDGDMIYKAIV